MDGEGGCPPCIPPVGNACALIEPGMAAMLSGCIKGVLEKACGLILPGAPTVAGCAGAGGAEIGFMTDSAENCGNGKIPCASAAMSSG